MPRTFTFRSVVGIHLAITVKALGKKDNQRIDTLELKRSEVFLILRAMNTICLYLSFGRTHDPGKKKKSSWIM